MSRDNQIALVRPTSTFESFEVYNASQQRVIDFLTTVADRFIEEKECIFSQRNPFDHARLVNISGKPGYGKTHLSEAFVNRLVTADERFQTRIYVGASGYFMSHFHLLFGSWQFEGTPILVFDDLYADEQSIEELHPRTDIPYFMNFVRRMYEDRAFVLTTTNFPLTKGIARRIQEVDTVGRTTSRLYEMLQYSSDFQLRGKDFRQVITTRYKKSKKR